MAATAYPVREHGGIVWAYMGKDAPPALPNWELFGWPDGFVQVVTAVVPCNWLQAQENSIDPVHFEWLHETWTRRRMGDDSFVAARHRKLMFEEEHFGFVYGRERAPAQAAGAPRPAGERPRGGEGRGVFLWPNGLYAIAHIEWRVPIDEENTLSVGWFFDPVPRDRRPYVQGRIPCWTAPVLDELTGRPIASHIMNQDFVAWIGQGRIAAREREHLGPSDRGVLLARRRLLEEAEVVKRGGTPKRILPAGSEPSTRGAGVSAPIELPVDGREYLRRGPTREFFEAELARTVSLYGTAFPFLAGQPRDVAEGYAEAMGISEEAVYGERVGKSARSEARL